jgi:hypothetical protein
MNQQTILGGENVVAKRKKKRTLSSIDSAMDGAARNSGRTKEELFT